MKYIIRFISMVLFCIIIALYDIVWNFTLKNTKEIMKGFTIKEKGLELVGIFVIIIILLISILLTTKWLLPVIRS